jgi:hypothetical protein
MIMSRANSAPVITFSVPTLKVTPVPVRGSLVGMRGDTAGQVSYTLMKVSSTVSFIFFFVDSPPVIRDNSLQSELILSYLLFPFRDHRDA